MFTSFSTVCWLLFVRSSISSYIPLSFSPSFNLLFSFYF
jgi:hypothetical protein